MTNAGRSHRHKLASGLDGALGTALAASVAACAALVILGSVVAVAAYNSLKMALRGK